MAAGETAESIRHFLGGISLSGIPQPLEYLIAEAAARYGLVRVAPTPEGGSRVRSTDAGLLRAIAVDASYVYVAGYESVDIDNSRWRIMKLLK